MQSRSSHTLVIRLSAVVLFGSMVSLARADLVGWWPFDGNLNEGSGKGLHATQIGTPTFADPRPGLAGQSIRFPEGDAHGVNLEPNPVLDAEIFTLGYFINLEGLVQGNAGLERLTSRGGDLFETAVGDAHAVGGTTSETGITLSYYQGGWNVTHVPVPAEGWIHVAWQNTASEITLYLDGVPVYVGLPVPAGRISGLMNIGLRHNNNTEGFEGSMDDVFLWNDAENPLTAEDIAAIAANGLATHLGLAVDSDGDGLPDVWETRHNLDPADNGSVNPINGAQGDPDNDTSRNATEYADGTDPRDDDTDDDGLKDGAEAAAGGNPTRADTDSDGLNDGAEVTAGTGVNDPDSDDDGYQDGFEVAKGSNPLNPASVPSSDALLIMHINFDDDSVSDLTGNGHDGTLLGTAGFSDNLPPGIATGKSLSLTGVDTDGVTIAAAPELNTNPFTLAYFFNVNNVVQGNAGLERLTSRGGDAFETAVGNAQAVGGTTSSTGLTLSYFQGGWRVTHVEIPLEGWVHAAWRNRLEGMDLFINGQLAYSGPAVPATRPTGHMNIGIRHNNVSEGFEGLMDDVRLYAAALSDDDIATIAAGGTGAPLRITALQRNPQTRAVSITWTSQQGRVYTIEHSANLRNWTVLSDNHVSGGASTIFTDTTPGVNDTVRFYRVHQN